MAMKQRPLLNASAVARCFQCAEHTDIRCSGCHKPMCRRHNAAPSTSFYCYCYDCRAALVAAAMAARKEQAQ